nr:VOC family protein [Rhodococcus sp. 06-1059B-a]
MSLELFHVGIAVPDLESAMEKWSASYSYAWRPVVERRNMRMFSFGVEHSISLRRTYSVDGPPYIELVEYDHILWAPGGVLSGTHIGFWVDDMQAEISRLRAIDHRLLVSDVVDIESASPSFAYLSTSSGALIELIPRSRLNQILNVAGGGQVLSNSENRNTKSVSCASAERTLCCNSLF